MRLRLNDDKLKIAGIVLCVVLFFLPAAAQTADTIVTNGRIYTVDPKQPWAEALAIRDGRIVAVGTLAEIGKLRGSSTRVIDAGQRLVLPGFTDSHIHFYEGSILMDRLHLDDATSVREVQRRVKEYAEAHPKAPWILGRGWNYALFEAALPDKKDLDAVVRDRPVFLVGYDGHSTWVNSKALEAAGITRSTPDPPNGAIVHDASGEPTGALKEDADRLVRRVIPEPSSEEKLAALRRGLTEANRAGLVRVHCAGGSDESSDFQTLDLLDQLRRENHLTVRFYVAYYMDPAKNVEDGYTAIRKARRQYHDDWIAAGAAKFYLDGVVESHTAAMLTPYSDDPTQMGKLFWDPEKYKQAVEELDSHGVQIFTHAIGERAVRLAFDAFEAAAKTNGTKDARPRIEHIETISAQDIPRFGKLGVIASFQPLHAYPDDDLLKVWARNAGPDRASRAWAWQSVAKAGGREAFGSDWPVVTLNPWEGIQNAVTRQTREGKPDGGWYPEQHLTVAQAIEGYTSGAAFAGHREKTEGSLETGKVADLIVVSQNLFDVDPHRLADTHALLTMVGGKVVYESPDFDAKTADHQPSGKTN